MLLCKLLEFLEGASLAVVDLHLGAKALNGVGLVVTPSYLPKILGNFCARAWGHACGHLVKGPITPPGLNIPRAHSPEIFCTQCEKQSRNLTESV